MGLNPAMLFFEMFLGVFIFTVAKACEQTRRIYRHTHSLRNTYLYLIWTEAFTNLLFAVFNILYIGSILPGAPWFYTVIVVLWLLQVEILPQIIANRVALIMIHKRKAMYLKWGLAAAITPVCLAVAYIWIIAHVEGATPAAIRLNFYFEKAEKSFFLVIDLALNLYFLYLVRFNLIAAGLTKYWKLFNFNCGMVVISTAMDVLLLGFLSLEDPYIYVQFAPLAYIVKLYIELVMARMISVVVRSTHNGGNEPPSSHSWSRSDPTSKGAGTSHGTVNRGGTMIEKFTRTKPAVREGSSGSDIHLATYNAEPYTITKTIETTVQESESRHNGSEYDRHGRAIGIPQDIYKERT